MTDLATTWTGQRIDCRLSGRRAAYLDTEKAVLLGTTALICACACFAAMALGLALARLTKHRYYIMYADVRTKKAR